MKSSKNELIRQYTFKSFSIADSKSDSIRILTYLVVPNNVLKFVKNNDLFESSYQAKVTIKKKRGAQIGRKSWSNTLKTKSYTESSSNKISTIHFYEFKVAPDDYIISSELFDMDSNESGIINREIKLKKAKSTPYLHEPFLIDSFDGNWGLGNDEIPIVSNLIGKTSVKPTLFLSGRIDTGKYKINVIINSTNKKELWNQSFDIFSDENYFYQRIAIPEEVISKGLRKRFILRLNKEVQKRKKQWCLVLLVKVFQNQYLTLIRQYFQCVIFLLMMSIRI